MEEIWKDIKGYEGLYQVSNLGRVKSLGRIIIRTDGKKKNIKERILKPRLNSNGYLCVGFSNNAKVKPQYVHRLVAQTFIPIPEHLKDIPIEKLEVGHLKTMPNGLEDKTANEVWNLAWMSKSENSKYGTLPQRKSEIHKGKKLSEETKIKIGKAAKGRKLSDETRKKMSAAQKGKKLSEEHRIKMIETLKNGKCSKSVLQYDLNGNFISEFPSTREIQRQFGFVNQSISACCLGKLKQAYGYIWKYKESAA